MASLEGDMDDRWQAWPTVRSGRKTDFFFLRKESKLKVNWEMVGNVARGNEWIRIERNECRGWETKVKSGEWTGASRAGYWYGEGVLVLGDNLLHIVLCSPVVTICTASLTLNNSRFCPHSVFMCFVWISEQTVIISLYNINWLVFITEI